MPIILFKENAYLWYTKLKVILTNENMVAYNLGVHDIFTILL